MTKKIPYLCSMEIMLKKFCKKYKLPEKSLFDLLSHMEEVSFSKGELIIRKGDRNSNFYLIKKGIWRAYFACWIAIRKADRVILAGDYCQLPPTIKCMEAARGGLDRTLMQEIANNKPDTVSLLKVQYRMNDEIMRFSSEWFYQGELKSAPEVKYRSILDYDTPIEWINTEGMECNEEFVGESFGRINKEEAALSISQLTNYINKIGKDRFLEERIDVGLISPYKAQVQYLRQLIKRDAFFKPYRHLITINTVDGFQGQERDVILISLVRANEEGQIGFLNDLRRMNVAITRARMKLIILGDASTLTKHPFYKKLYEYILALQE